jgi:hypothetical protein
MLSINKCMNFYLINSFYAFQFHRSLLWGKKVCIYWKKYKNRFGSGFRSSKNIGFRFGYLLKDIIVGFVDFHHLNAISYHSAFIHHLTFLIWSLDRLWLYDFVINNAKKQLAGDSLDWKSCHYWTTHTYIVIIVWSDGALFKVFDWKSLLRMKNDYTGATFPTRAGNDPVKCMKTRITIRSYVNRTCRHEKFYA